MNESRKYNKYRVKGSSLLESVIAVTIIATCLLIAIRLYVMVLNSSSSFNSYKIKFKVSQLYQESKISQDFSNEFYDFKTYSIRKTVQEYQANKGLKKINFYVQTISDTTVYSYLVKQKGKYD